MNKALLLMIFVLVSCGKNSSDSSQDHQKLDEVSRTESKRFELEQTIQSILEDVSSQRLSKTEGLNKIAELIGGDKIQNAGDESILKIAKAIIYINGNIAENLEILFGLEEVKLDTQNESLIIDSIFLNLAHSGFDHSIAMDRVLISYVSLLVSSSANQINDTEILRYFSMRFHHLRQLMGLDANDLLGQYSTLSELISPEKLFHLFQQDFETLKINNNHSFATRKLYATLLDQKLASAEDITFQKTLFESAANNAMWAINNMGQELSAMAYSANIVSDYFSLFDRVEKIESKNAWIDAIDYRSENIAYELYQKLQEHLKNGLEIDKLLFNKNHPYYDLYLNKALLLSGLENSYRNIEEFKDDFYRGLLNYNRGVRFTSNYLKGYYDVEIKKQFLSFKDTNKAERQEAYDSLLTSLIETLNERDGKYELTLEKLRTAKVRDDLYYSIALGNSSSINNEQTYLKNYCLNSNCSKKVFKAGIYVAPFGDIENKHIEIYAKDIRFTPLAMIYAPGGNVFISARNIEDLWIDSSGLHGKVVGFSEEENQVAFPTVNCSTRGHNFGKDTRNGKIKTCTIEKELISPQAQPQAGDIYDLQVNGKNAGRITLSMHFDGKIDGMSLLASRGGNGADGKKGLRAAPKGKACQNSLTLETGELKTWEAFVDHGRLHFNPDSMLSIHVSEYRWDSRSSGKLKKQTYTIKKSRGGKGGDAGNGMKPLFQVATSEFVSQMNNVIDDAGVAGIGGEAGECGTGSNEEYKGKDGSEGTIL